MGWGLALASDASGTFYAAGTTLGEFDKQTLPGTAGIVLSKMDPTGRRLWSRIWGPTNTYAIGAGIALDTAGHIYVAGTTLGDLLGAPAVRNGDFCLIKVNDQGTPLWIRIWGSAQEDVANDVTVDQSGSLQQSAGCRECRCVPHANPK